MPKKIEVREGDRLLIWVRAPRVSDDGDEVTISLPNGHRSTLKMDLLEIEKTEKGPAWPDR